MDPPAIWGFWAQLKFQMNGKETTVSSEAFENIVLNGFTTKEESGICQTGRSTSLAEGTKFYSRLVLFHCDAPGSAPTSSVRPRPRFKVSVGVTMVAQGKNPPLGENNCNPAKQSWRFNKTVERDTTAVRQHLRVLQRGRNPPTSPLAKYTIEE